MSETIEVPVCIYETKDRAKKAEVQARLEIAEVLKKHGALAAVIAIAMVHRDGSETRVNLGVEGAGSPQYAHDIVDRICKPELFK